MCPDCGSDQVVVKQFEWSESHGLDGPSEHGTDTAFVCQQCGWYGDTNDFRVPCTTCRRSVAWAAIELDKDCNVVCRECYLANVPQEDIDGALHDAVATNKTLGGEKWLQ
jgi:hypothetical protein